MSCETPIKKEEVSKSCKMARLLENVLEEEDKLLKGYFIQRIIDFIGSNYTIGTKEARYSRPAYTPNILCLQKDIVDAVNIVSQSFKEGVQASHLFDSGGNLHMWLDSGEEESYKNVYEGMEVNPIMFVSHIDTIGAQAGKIDGVSGAVIGMLNFLEIARSSSFMDVANPVILTLFDGEDKAPNYSGNMPFGGSNAFCQGLSEQELDEIAEDDVFLQIADIEVDGRTLQDRSIYELLLWKQKELIKTGEYNIPYESIEQIGSDMYGNLRDTPTFYELMNAMGISADNIGDITILESHMNKITEYDVEDTETLQGNCMSIIDAISNPQFPEMAIMPPIVGENGQNEETSEILENPENKVCFTISIDGVAQHSATCPMERRMEEDALLQSCYVAKDILEQCDNASIQNMEVFPNAVTSIPGKCHFTFAMSSEEFDLLKENHFFEGLSVDVIDDTDDSVSNTGIAREVGAMACAHTIALYEKVKEGDIDADPNGIRRATVTALDIKANGITLKHDIRGTSYDPEKPRGRLYEEVCERRQELYDKIMRQTSNKSDYKEGIGVSDWHVEKAFNKAIGIGMDTEFNEILQTIGTIKNYSTPSIISWPGQDTGNILTRGIKNAGNIRLHGVYGFQPGNGCHHPYEKVLNVISYSATLDMFGNLVNMMRINKGRIAEIARRMEGYETRGDEPRTDGCTVSVMYDEEKHAWVLSKNQDLSASRANSFVDVSCKLRDDSTRLGPQDFGEDGGNAVCVFNEKTGRRSVVLGLAPNNDPIEDVLEQRVKESYFLKEPSTITRLIPSGKEPNIRQIYNFYNNLAMLCVDKGLDVSQVADECVRWMVESRNPAEKFVLLIDGTPYLVEAMQFEGVEEEKVNHILNLADESNLSENGISYHFDKNVLVLAKKIGKDASFYAVNGFQLLREFDNSSGSSEKLEDGLYYASTYRQVHGARTLLPDSEMRSLAKLRLERLVEEAKKGNIAIASRGVGADSLLTYANYTFKVPEGDERMPTLFVCDWRCLPYGVDENLTRVSTEGDSVVIPPMSPEFIVSKFEDYIKRLYEIYEDCRKGLAEILDIEYRPFAKDEPYSKSAIGRLYDIDNISMAHAIRGEGIFVDPDLRSFMLELLIGDLGNYATDDTNIHNTDLRRLFAPLAYSISQGNFVFNQCMNSLKKVSEFPDFFLSFVKKSEMKDEEKAFWQNMSNFLQVSLPDIYLELQPYLYLLSFLSIENSVETFVKYVEKFIDFNKPFGDSYEKNEIMRNVLHWVGYRYFKFLSNSDSDSTIESENDLYLYKDLNRKMLYFVLKTIYTYHENEHAYKIAELFFCEFLNLSNIWEEAGYICSDLLRQGNVQESKYLSCKMYITLSMLPDNFEYLLEEDVDDYEDFIDMLNVYLKSSRKAINTIALAKDDRGAYSIRTEPDKRWELPKEKLSEEDLERLREEDNMVDILHFLSDSGCLFSTYNGLERDEFEELVRKYNVFVSGFVGQYMDSYKEPENSIPLDDIRAFSTEDARKLIMLYFFMPIQYLYDIVPQRVFHPGTCGQIMLSDPLLKHKRQQLLSN